MKRGILLIICLSLVFTMFLMPGIIAPYETIDDDNEEPESVVTGIALYGEGNVIEWEVDGYSEKGFKIAWSLNENPEYPSRDGDYWDYYPDPSSRRAELSSKGTPGEYYVRVCEYLGGECGLYSNQVKVTIGESEKVETVSTEKTSVETIPEVTTEAGVESILLKHEEKNHIKWKVEGYSPNGFKVVWSKDENPTYPTRKNDRYHYHSNPHKDYDLLKAFDGKGEYHVIVCEYLGGNCGVYSNEIVIYLDEEDDLKDIIKSCSEDAKVCEDGTVLTRDPSNDCEFPECPEEVKVCPAVCVEMWEIKFVGGSDIGPTCGYNECGSGCGPDNEGTFSTEDECQEALVKWDGKDDSYEIDYCNGCLMDEVCYPLGYRKDGKFCFDDFVFEDQKLEDSSCDNNWECESNLCLDNECVSGGLIRKVMNWLRNFFGSDK
jgi:hypothetical protein